VVEDYAFGASVRAHAKGECGAMLRVALMEAGVPFRLHDPTTVKLYTAGRGDATADEIAEAAREAWCVDWSRYNAEARKGGEPCREVEQDLAAAFALARLGLHEQLVRSGAVPLSALRENERRVFLRVTKSTPTNVLDRPFVIGAEPAAAAR
jgi:transposase